MTEDPLAVVAIGSTELRIYRGHVATRLPDGTEVPAVPDASQGHDRDWTGVHEALHTIIAGALGNHESLCLRNAANGTRAKDTSYAAWTEENLAMAMTRPVYELFRALKTAAIRAD